MDRIQAAWKFLLSFCKSDWDLDDYPIRIHNFPESPKPHGRSGPPFTWSAQIIYWWAMGGYGYSRSEALGTLADNFVRRKREGPPLPRPGSKAPITFASADRIRQHEGLAADFVKRVLGLKYEECFISDQSSLWDFHHSESNEALHRRIAELYHVDVSDIESGVLADILERIAERSGAG